MIDDFDFMGSASSKRIPDSLEVAVAVAGGGGAHVVLGFGGFELAGDAQIVVAGFALVLGGYALANLSVELAPGGVDEPDGLINGFELIVDLTVSIEVFPAIFKKVP